MSKKLTGKTLAIFEATRDVWQEVLDGVREIKSGKGKWTNVEAKSYVVRVRCTIANCTLTPIPTQAN